MKLLLKQLLLGNKQLQNFYWSLYKFSLKGMNYDRGHVPTRNGEPFVLEHVLNLNSGNDKIIIFDVGANRGQYLKMILSKNFDKLHEIHCFEPQRSAYLKILEISKKNTGIIVNNLALGTKKETLPLFKNSEASEYGSLYESNYEQHNINLIKSELVAIDTLDNYCQEHNIPYIDFLKIDVEGHEIEVLKGAYRLLNAGMIKNIQFEFGMASIESRIFLKDFIKILKDFDVYRILPNSLVPIKYNEYHEIFLTTNYLAKRKI